MKQKLPKKRPPGRPKGSPNKPRDPNKPKQISSKDRKMLLENPNYVKNPQGAPRKTSFTKEEMIELGKEMVTYVLENDVLHLSEWYTIEKMFIYNQWKTFIQCEEFIPFYQQAKCIVGRKYLDKNSNVRDKISDRWQRLYFADLREEEDQTSKYNAEIRKAIDGIDKQVIVNIVKYADSGDNS